MTQTIIEKEGRHKVWVSADHGSYKGVATLYEVERLTLAEYLQEIESCDLLCGDAVYESQCFINLQAFKTNAIAWRVVSDADFPEKDELFTSYSHAHDCACSQFC